MTVIVGVKCLLFDSVYLKYFEWVPVFRPFTVSTQKLGAETKVWGERLDECDTYILYIFLHKSMYV